MKKVHELSRTARTSEGHERCRDRHTATAHEVSGQEGSRAERSPLRSLAADRQSAGVCSSHNLCAKPPCLPPVRLPGSLGVGACRARAVVSCYPCTWPRALLRARFWLITAILHARLLVGAHTRTCVAVRRERHRRLPRRSERTGAPSMQLVKCTGKKSE